jgi:hypothetical protein
MKLRPKSPASTIVDFVLAIGGAKATALIQHSLHANTIAVALDNAKEMAARYALHDELGITSVTIGERNTTLTLFAKAPIDKQRGIRRKANTAVHMGMGANAVVGEQAALLYVASPEAKALAESLVERVFELTGGSPELVRFRILISYVGGVGAGQWRPLAYLLADAFREIGIPVALEIDALGPICFTRLSKNCRLNAGAVLPALVDFVTDNSNTDLDLITRRLELSELPPLGQQGELRDQLLNLEEQALSSAPFRDKREVVIPNAGTVDGVGNIYLRQTDFVGWLDPIGQVRPAVAAALQQPVHQGLEFADIAPALFRQELWEDDGQERSRASVETILLHASNYTLPALTAAICQEGFNHKFRLSFTLQDGSRFDAHHVDQLCCVPPATLDDALARLQLLASTVKTSLEICDDCQAAIALVEADQAVAARRLESAFRLVRRGGWFVSRRRAAHQLVKYATLVRSLSDERMEWQAKLAEVQNVAKKADREERKLRQQLVSIDRILTNYLPHAHQLATRDYVRVREPNAAFPVLLSLIGKSTERQTQILCSLAEAVTLDGLAVMLGTSFVDIQEIAQRVVAGPAAYSSPPSGGVRRQSEATTIYALPPLDEPFAGLLGKAVAQLRSPSDVVFGDTMAAGAGVLRIHYRNVHSMSEIFVGLLKHNTLKAHTRPDREMLCLGGEESLRNLGMSVNGDLQFSDQFPDRFPAALQQSDPDTDPKGTSK